MQTFMSSLEPGSSDSQKSILLVVAAPSEARAILRVFPCHSAAAELVWRRMLLQPGVELVVTGVGKVNAAGAVGLLARVSTDRVVVSAGLGGALPGQALSIGDTVIASESVYGDEGVETPEGFETLDQIGFPLGPFPNGRIMGDPTALEAIRPLCDHVGPVATVSTCSGTDARAEAIARRTGAIAEGMEGAAIGHVCARLGIPFVEVRVISNTTGNRASQQWDLRGSLSKLGAVTARIVGALTVRDWDSRPR